MNPNENLTPINQEGMSPDQGVSYTPPQSWGEDRSATPVEVPQIETSPLETPPLVTPPVETINRPSPIIRPILIGIALILLGTLIGLLASHFLPATPTLPISLQPTSFPTSEATPEPSPTEIVFPTPTATPSALLGLKWNVMTVSSPVSRYHSYRLSYPTTWSIKEYKNIPEVIGKNQASSTLILQKGAVSLSILQNDGEGTACWYPGSANIEGRMIRFSDYRSINKDTFTWRWSESIPEQGAVQSIQVCEQPQGGLFSTSTSIGFISLSSEGADSNTLEEFNYILEKIIILSSSKYTCPSTEWVDCEPSPDGVKPQCTTEYLKWAETNCPGFRGAAL